MSGWTPPAEFDGYKLIRLIGQGGMGQVYLAHDTVLDRPVAVKLVSAVDPDESTRARFFLEARAIARLQHPNVVSIYRVGEVQGYPYLVSELIRGTSLDRAVTPMAWERVLGIGMGIARGLAAAHRRGVVHRDVKPANVILSEDGEAKLLDFGIAKLLGPRPADGTSGPPRQNSEPASDGRRSMPTTAVRIAAAPREDASAGLEVDCASAEMPTTAVIVRTNAPVSTPVPASSVASASASASATPAVWLTSPGVVMGTPSYIAPEMWRGEPASFRSDVYSLGALLYALCAGHPPHATQNLTELSARARGEDAAPLVSVAPAVDPRFGAVVDRCLRREPGDRYATANDVRGALAELTPEARGNVIPEGNPFRGLSVFEAAHRGLFFGRDSQIRGVLERLRTDSFVLVAGDSGVGKSSLCRAGVLPRLGDWFGRERAWSAVAMVPGSHPVTALAAVLGPQLGLAEYEVAAMIRNEPSAFARELRRRQGDKAGLLIFVDQLEELVTLAEPAEAAAVTELLGWLSAPAPSIRMLATVRGDFLSRLASLPDIGEAVLRSLYFLRPLARERIREAIVGPAAAKGVTFESEGLVETLVDSTVNAEGGLPLLQFALAELWEERDPTTKTITAAALRSVGGVAGALARHADEVLARLDHESGLIARRILLALVAASGTRARRSEAELTFGEARAATVLGELVRGRLLVARESGEASGHEIAHEALITSWGTLVRWRAADADGRIVRERLGAAVGEWERLGRAREALWSALQLREAQALDEAALKPEATAFLRASRRALSRARRLRVLAAVAASVVLALTYGGIRLQQRLEVGQRVGDHLARSGAALASARALRAEEKALRGRAYGLFDAPELEEAERVWAQALPLGSALGPAFGRASEELEEALMLDATREDVRAALADVLQERALVAEDLRHTAEKDELLRRLSVHDAGGARRALWDAPGRLSIATSPAAVLSLRHVTADERGVRRLDAAVALGTAPIEERVLEQGSYVLAAEAPERASTWFPVSIGRGEEVRVTLELPRKRDVPEGFVYVPAGRFLFGSAADDGLRRTFFNAVPIHEVHTGAYLIARNETTFAEWIRYLRALPEGERAAELPRVDKGGFQGALSLSAVSGDSFELAFQPTSRMYTARAGEAVSFPGRTRRASQDWLRFPVFGISLEQAGRFTAWLDRSGRVKGARLCTDHEWERAARGSDDREYPHGDSLQPEDANYDETYERKALGIGPDEVGSHPGSRSPFGLDDMAGNVWEWVLSSLVTGEHAARGGSYSYDSSTSRSYNRELTDAAFRDVAVGMRVCAGAPR